jgi:DNA polymerase-1
MLGTTANLIKRSMVKVQQVLDVEGRGTQKIMQVHDELVFKVPLTAQKWVRTEIPRLMAGVAQLKAPSIAEIGMDKNREKRINNTYSFVNIFL